jgi:hypothetical protein
MPSRNEELVRGLYGFNWADVSDRGRGLAAAQEALAPDVRARMSPEVSDRTLVGVDDFAGFVAALEQDFSEFRYLAGQVEEISPEQVRVTGEVHARGRMSKMPLTVPFAHLWTVVEGCAVQVEASLLR